ncbi:importin-5-like [Oculina patagonica]
MRTSRRLGNMVAVMASEQQQFESLVSQLMSPDNNIRNQAEAHYDTIDEPTKIKFLIQMIRTSGIPEVRQMSAVLLRRIYSSSVDFYDKLDPAFQQEMKDNLLKAIQEEQVQTIRKKVCDAVAELSRSLLDEEGYNHWQELLKFLFECCNSQKPELKESALHIFVSFPGIFGTQQEHYMQVIKQMLWQCLQDQSSQQVRFMSARASVAFITDQVEEIKQRQFVELVPGIVQAVRESVQASADDSVLKCLIDLADTCPKLLRANLEPILDLMLEIVRNTDLVESWRHLSLECVVTLAETAPAMLRKCQKHIPIIVPEMLAMMVDLEDDPEWSVSDELDDEDAESNSVAGESSLDRLACGLGGKTVLPHIIVTVPQMLQNADWRYRHAGLMAISAVGEGCYKQMEALLPDIVNTVLPFLTDSHPRVRYAACNAVGQLSTDFAQGFQKKFHTRVIPGLLVVLDDTANPRVQAHAAAALVNFSDDCPKNILASYLDNILAKLEAVLASKLRELERGGKLVLEQVVTTIATVADTAEEKFLHYYDRFMPNLKYIMQNALSSDYRMLRGKTIECISLIGLAVGKEKFLPDANEVMQLLLKTQTEMEELEADDPQISYMISAWARMCKIFGTEFTQYLPLVMPSVMKAASIKPEVAVIDADDPKSGQYSEDEGWQFITLGDQQKFGIKTAGLEDKSTACQMLVCYARELKEGFAPYTEQVVKLMVPLLKFYFHDLVRTAAAESLPYLLECAKIKGDAYLRQMWAFMCPEVLKAMSAEPEPDVQILIMDALARCIETLGVGCMTPDYFTELGTMLHDTIDSHKNRQVERQQRRKEEDYDEEVEEDLQDEHETDVHILSKVSDIMHALFGTHKEAALPFFEQLLPDFHSLLAPSGSAQDKQWSLCVFDDVIEHTGSASFKYQEYFLRPMMNYVLDRNADVRQAACYGCGVMAQYGGEEYVSACAEVVPVLFQAIKAEDSRSRENVNATENAISAVAKICKYNRGNIALNEVIPALLATLPITEDKEEAPHVYGYVCDLIEENNPLVLGTNNSNLPRILQIFAELFINDVLSDDEAARKRVLAIIRQIQSAADMWTACVGQLSELQQEALKQALEAES